jgi:tetratricopeptide (TPR) repeat protein
LAPDNLLARSRLALGTERTGRVRQAVTEYLALAAILQKSGQNEKAAQAIEQGLRLAPGNTELLRAKAALQASEVLAIPPPIRPRATAPLIAPQPSALSSRAVLPEAKETEAPATNPFELAQHTAITLLAELLFEAGQLTPAQPRAGLGDYDTDSNPSASRDEVLPYLAQAIDAFSRGMAKEAQTALERAIRVGCDHPAAHFALGAMLLGAKDARGAVPSLQRAVDHPALSTGAHFGLGRAYRQLEQPYQSALHFLSALQLADLTTVPEEMRETLQRQYETFLEVDEPSQPASQWLESAQRVESLLSGTEWESRLRLARAQLDAESEGHGLLPLASMLAMGRPQALIEAMAYVDAALRRDLLKTAMEQALLALDQGPTYLPLHVRIAEIQLREGRQEASISKLRVVARTYRIRGDKAQAARVLERILQLSPMDTGSRTELIELALAQDDVRTALSQYLDLGEIYSQLAEQDKARKAYETALTLIRPGGPDASWEIQLLYRLGDHYLQRLDWRSALQAYTRLMELDSSDERAASQVIGLLLKLRKPTEAQAVLDHLAQEWSRQGRQEQLLYWFEELVRLNPQDPTVRKKLAEGYQQRGRIPEAIAQLDALGEILIDSGKTPEAIQVVRAILALNAPGADGYRRLLQQLQSGSTGTTRG